MKLYITHPPWWPFRPLDRDIVETTTMEPLTFLSISFMIKTLKSKFLDKFLDLSTFSHWGMENMKSMNYYYLIYNLKTESDELLFVWLPFLYTVKRSLLLEVYTRYLLPNSYFPITGANLSILSSHVKQTLLVDRYKQADLKKNKTGRLPKPGRIFLSKRIWTK